MVGARLSGDCWRYLSTERCEGGINSSTIVYPVATLQLQR